MPAFGSNNRISSKAFREASIKLTREMEGLQKEVKGNTDQLVLARKMELEKVALVADWRIVERNPAAKQFPLVQYQ